MVPKYIKFFKGLVDQFLGMFSNDMGIDLGTATTLVFVRGEGVVLCEPSVVAIEKDTNRVVAVGEEAKRMLGRTPENIVAIRPMKDGVISDPEVTEAMLKYFIKKVQPRRFLVRPSIVIAIPPGITEVEKRAVIDSAEHAGARSVILIEQPKAAAIGVGLPVQEPGGNMVIDIGGGTAEMAVISLGGVVASTSVRVGGNKLDAAILEYIRKKYNLAIGERTAEEIKINIGSALYMEDKLYMEVRGRDIVTGLPRSITVSSDDVTEAIQHELEAIIAAAKKVLHKTPPELSADIMDKGIVLTGGSALLRNMDQLIARTTGVPAYVADDAMLCVAKGTGIALDNLDSYKRSILATK